MRAYHYVVPFTQLRPQQLRLVGAPDWVRDVDAGHFWVPMDDHTCMVWNFLHSYGEEPIEDEERREYGNGNGPDHVDQTTFRAFRNARNNWGIDRAVQESMGPVVDRSEEYLGPADKAIIAMRRLLLQAVQTVQAGGSPPAVNTSYYNLRAIERIVPDGEEWRDSVLPLMDPAAAEEARELAAVR